MRSTMLRTGVLVALTAMLTACGGGNTNSLPYQPPSGSSFTTSTTSSTTLPSLTSSGFTVTGTLSATSVAALIQELLSVSAPSGVTPLSQRRAAASHTLGAVVGTATNLLYVTFSSSTTVTLPTSPALTFTSSAIVSGTAYSLALFSGGAWTAPIGVAQLGGTGTVSFPSYNTPVTIGPNAPATYVLYTGTATTTAIVLLPATLTFDAGAPSSSSFSASEISYSGAFSATMTCTENPAGQSPGSNAFVAQFMGGGTTASQTPSSAGGTVTFNVNSGAETGACPVVVTDTNGNTSTVTIDVSSSSVTVTGKQRN